MYIYEQGFKFFKMGYASTVALSLFVAILILTAVQFRLSRRWVFYQ
jgi:multiple sugar transport system permease protein